MFGRKKKREQEETMIRIALRKYVLRINRPKIGKHAEDEWGDWLIMDGDSVPPAVREILSVPSVIGTTISYRTGDMKAEYRVYGNES